MNNLPPGVSITDIPGNRPEDQEWEDFCEWAIKKMQESRMTVEELRAVIENALKFDDDPRARAQQREIDDLDAYKQCA